MSLENKIRRSIQATSEKMFFCSDFKKFNPDTNQVRRVLRSLVKDGVLVRTGGGSYVKTKTSQATGNKIPVLSLEEIGRCYLRKKSIRFEASQAVKDYNKGLTTQVPTNPVFVTKKSVTAKVGYKDKLVSFRTIP